MLPERKTQSECCLDVVTKNEQYSCKWLHKLDISKHTGVRSFIHASDEFRDSRWRAGGSQLPRRVMAMDGRQRAVNPRHA